MNQKQKTIIEKMIKLRYNSLIRAVQSTATQVERDNSGTTVPHFLFASHSRTEDSWTTAGLTEDEKAFVLSTHRKVLICADIFNRITKAREEACRDAREKRTAYVALLASERDKAIMDLHFASSDDEVKAYIAALPTPESVAQALGMTEPLKLEVVQ